MSQQVKGSGERPHLVRSVITGHSAQTLLIWASCGSRDTLIRSGVTISQAGVRKHYL